jgi:TATA-box binding protein (TBP) (component of TFIID and TFIIIB)
MESLDGEWEKFLNNANDFNKDAFDKVTNIFEEEKDDIVNIPKGSDIYISTKSQIIYLSEPIEILDIFWKLDLIKYYEPKEGIIMKQIKISCENDKDIEETDKNIKEIENARLIILSNTKINSQKKKFIKTIKITVGYCSKDINSIRAKNKKAFYNCLVLIIRLKLETKFKEMHVKIFNTGKIEIPGIQNDWILERILEKIIEYLKPFNNNLYWKPESLQTILINSNFDCNFHINREQLKNILKYENHLEVHFDPCVYPGIQCKYYFNNKNNGICYCDNKDKDETKCSLVKRKSRCNCIGVSFMIFRTGNILIVGHCTTEILMIVYEFLKKILETNYFKIKDDHKNLIKKKNPNKKIRKKDILVNN